MCVYIYICHNKELFPSNCQFTAIDMRLYLCIYIYVFVYIYIYTRMENKDCQYIQETQYE